MNILSTICPISHKADVQIPSNELSLNFTESSESEYPAVQCSDTEY